MPHKMEAWLCSSDPVERAHATWRLAQGDTLHAARSTLDDSLIPLAEALELHRLMHRCGYRSTTGCGCSGARCGLQSAMVSHRECLACVRTFGAA